MSIDPNEFEDLFDPEVMEELNKQFNELQIKKQEEFINSDPKRKWFMEFSLALSQQGIRYFMSNDEEIIYVQLSKGLMTEGKAESIYIEDIEEYRYLDVSPEALAAAIKAGLLSPVFIFWKKVGEDYEED
jgi:hypothetical protein